MSATEKYIKKYFVMFDFHNKNIKKLLCSLPENQVAELAMVQLLVTSGSVAWLFGHIFWAYFILFFIFRSLK